jgi:hypothetical protein
MPLILCPDCKKEISDRAEHCPHCDLPYKYFGTPVNKDNTANTTANTSLDLSILRNDLISFDHSYQIFFGAGHYITAHELKNLKASFEEWAEQLSLGGQFPRPAVVRDRETLENRFLSPHEPHGYINVKHFR